MQQLKQTLEEEHRHLVAELKTIAKPDVRLAGNWDARFPKFEETESGSHSARDEEADEVEEYEVRLATEGSLETRLLEVNKALERMRLGTYGICPKCGKAISDERLGANPAAEFDVKHST